MGIGSTPAFLMKGAPTTCSSTRKRGVVLFMSIMNVMASAAGESAAAPWGKSTTGAFDRFSIPASWVEAHSTSSRASWIATTVSWTFSMSVSDEPPTRTIELPAATAARHLLAAMSGVWSAGSMRMACLVTPDLAQT